MKKWKKNLLAPSVLLVVCVGIYTNWMYTNAEKVQNLNDVLDAEKVMAEDGIIFNDEPTADDSVVNTVSDYFAAVRLSRQQARDSAVELLQEAMAYSSDQSDESTSAQLEMIIQNALCEAQIESLIIAKGYTDCVAYLSEDGISVAVATPEGGMKQEDVAVIADIVMSQSGLELENIRVVEVQ